VPPALKPLVEQMDEALNQFVNGLDAAARTSPARTTRYRAGRSSFENIVIIVRQEVASYGAGPLAARTALAAPRHYGDSFRSTLTYSDDIPDADTSKWVGGPSRAYGDLSCGEEFHQVFHGQLTAV
jgi:hypothetical protein